MDILAIQDMEHVDALEFTRVTKQRFVQIQKLTANCKPWKWRF